MAVNESLIRVSKTKKVAMAMRVNTAMSNPKKSPLLALSQSIPVAPKIEMMELELHLLSKVKPHQTLSSHFNLINSITVFIFYLKLKPSVFSNIETVEILSLALLDCIICILMTMAEGLKYVFNIKKKYYFAYITFILLTL